MYLFFISNIYFAFDELLSAFVEVLEPPALILNFTLILLALWLALLLALAVAAILMHQILRKNARATVFIFFLLFFSFFFLKNQFQISGDGSQ